MVESVTLHYGWTKPEVTKSASTWGGYLNADLDAIDALVYANQQAIVPVGAITMFGGATAPTNWLICDGRSLSTAAPYAALFAVFGYTYGGSGASFNLPSLQQRFPMGAGPNPNGQMGGAFSYTFALGNLPAHSHSITDVAHTHAVNQWSHSHTISTGGHSHTISTGGHQHNITTGSHGHNIHTGQHQHSIPDNLVVGSGSGLTNGGASFSLHGSALTAMVGDLGGTADAVGNLGGTTDVIGDLRGSTNAVGDLGGSTSAVTSGVSLQASGSNLSTTNAAGGGAPISIVPPFIALNFIVRYQ